MKVLNQQFSVPFEYQVTFTKHLFDPENELFRHTVLKNAHQRPAKVFFVVDDLVSQSHPQLLTSIEAYCSKHPDALNLCAPPMLVTGGEFCKNTPQYVEQILQAVNDLAIDRHSYTVAIGGGAVLDMVGYASSIAHRGIRHIRIPTTVLAQNDAGIGVKNAINAFGKKNFLGCFVPPVAVINDLTFLTTLEDRDWRAGISEAIKVALIKDAPFFEWIEQHVERFVERDLDTMEHLIYECARLHLEHIAGGDPFELGSSRPLDFGHWAAHKLEYLTDYTVRHGEAVAIGIALDVMYSFLIGMLDETACNRIIQLIQKLGFQVYHPQLLIKQADHYALLLGLAEFREHLGGQLTIMLLEGIGKGVEVNQMDNDLLLKAIKKLEQLSSAPAI